MNIAAKPTLYAGTRFRSRLEARWARFFEAIGREWVYEPHVPELAGMQYQPDFLTSKSFGEGLTLIEVKPEVDAAETVRLMREERWHQIANLTKANFVLLFGSPGEWLEGKLVGSGHFGGLWLPDVEVVSYVEFAECLTCLRVNLWRDGVATCHPMLPSGPLKDAYIAVRNESYEDSR